MAELASDTACSGRFPKLACRRLIPALFLPEHPVLQRGDDEGDGRGDEGPDGLEAGDGLGVPLDLLLEREQAVNVKSGWVDDWMSGWVDEWMNG